MTVQFHRPEEFLKELGKDKELVERNIVRLTGLFKPTKISPNIRRLYVVATARVAGEVYHLECYCGDLWDISAQDESVHEKAEEITKLLQQDCAKLGLDVRDGIIE